MAKPAMKAFAFEPMDGQRFLYPIYPLSPRAFGLEENLFP
jgi:hypothetical protein